MYHTSGWLDQGGIEKGRGVEHVCCPIIIIIIIIIIITLNATIIIIAFIYIYAMYMQCILCMIHNVIIYILSSHEIDWPFENGLPYHPCSSSLLLYSIVNQTMYAASKQPYMLRPTIFAAAESIFVVDTKTFIILNDR